MFFLLAETCTSSFLATIVGMASNLTAMGCIERGRAPSFFKNPVEDSEHRPTPSPGFETAPEDPPDMPGGVDSRSLFRFPSRANTITTVRDGIYIYPQNFNVPITFC